MIKKLFSHTLVYGAAPQITKLANFVALPIITQDLTALDYGVSGVLTAFTAAISVFSSFGLKIVIVNGFYKYPGQYKWLWRQLYGFLTIWNFGYAILLTALIYFVIPEEAITNRWLIIFLNVLPLIFFGNTNTICSIYYQLNQRPFQIAVRSLIFGLGTVVLNIYFISYLKMGYMGWFWSAFIIGMITNASYYYPLNFVLGFKPILNFKWRLIRNSLKISLPTIPHFYSSYLLNSSDRAVMKSLKIDTISIGKYNAAYSLAGAMGGLSQASTQALSPILNGLYKAGNDEKAKNLIFILQIVFFACSFLLCIWMKEIFAFMIRNVELARVYPLGIVIVMGYNYRPMYMGAINKLMYAERTNIVWKVTFVAGIINVGLNLILIPVFGFEVAAYTTFIAFMYMGYAGFYSPVFKIINSADYKPMAWMLTTVLLTVVAYWIVEFTFVVKIIITFGITLFGSYLIGKLNKMINSDQ